MEASLLQKMKILMKLLPLRKTMIFTMKKSGSLLLTAVLTPYKKRHFCLIVSNFRFHQSALRIICRV